MEKNSFLFGRNPRGFLEWGFQNEGKNIRNAQPSCLCHLCVGGDMVDPHMIMMDMEGGVVKGTVVWLRIFFVVEAKCNGS